MCAVLFRHGVRGSYLRQGKSCGRGVSGSGDRRRGRRSAARGVHDENRRHDRNRIFIRIFVSHAGAFSGEKRGVHYKAGQFGRDYHGGATLAASGVQVAAAVRESIRDVSRNSAGNPYGASREERERTADRRPYLSGWYARDR